MCVSVHVNDPKLYDLHSARRFRICGGCECQGANQVGGWKDLHGFEALHPGIHSAAHAYITLKLCECQSRHDCKQGGSFRTGDELALMQSDNREEDERECLDTQDNEVDKGIELEDGINSWQGDYDTQEEDERGSVRNTQVDRGIEHIVITGLELEGIGKQGDCYSNENREKDEKEDMQLQQVTVAHSEIGITELEVKGCTRQDDRGIEQLAAVDEVERTELLCTDSGIECGFAS